ncbi:MAG: A17 family peptidase, partial [Bacteroides sp.]
MDKFYVDDCLASFDSIEDAAKFAVQCRKMLACGGFILKKWVSNNDNILAEIPENDRAVTPVNMKTSGTSMQRALGIQWHADTDLFSFQFDLPDRPYTRRGILSAVSSFYDPLGLLSPLCLPPKMLLQKLCRDGLGWDEPIGQDDIKTWQEWLRLVNSIGISSIPRCIQPQYYVSMIEKELHIFGDASETGYGIVAYLRCIIDGTEPTCTLLFGKSRVAPIKSVTIPRLELAAATLAVRTSQQLKGAMPNYFAKTFFWTDSRIVLHYINNTTSRFTTFVANRLATIHRYSSPKQWLHVKSAANYGDFASRGIRTQADLERWLTGPQSLEDLVEPLEGNLESFPVGVIELKSVHAVVNAAGRANVMQHVFDYYSKWMKLIRCFAWFKRYVEYLRSKRQGNSAINLGNLTVREYRLAQRKIIELVQHEVFSREVQLLSKAKGIKGSSLVKLNPILIDGLLCVGG